jgi:hypothetical protein
MGKIRFAAIAVAAFGVGSSTVAFAGNVAAQSQKQPTTITSTPSQGGPIGTVLTDSATVNGNNPTGHVRFFLFGPGNPNCAFPKGFIFSTGLIPLVNDQGATPNGFTAKKAGTYEWVVNYSGDPNNTEARSVCGKEAITITASLPTPVVTPGCINGVGEVTESGALDGWSWIIEPGDIDVTPITTDPESYGPLLAGPYTYEFRDAMANDITGGSFTVLECQTT